MTATVRLHCNGEHPDGDTCGSTLITGTATPEAARAVADANGWTCPGDGTDLCPSCYRTRPRLILTLEKT